MLVHSDFSFAIVSNRYTHKILLPTVAAPDVLTSFSELIIENEPIYLVQKFKIKIFLIAINNHSTNVRPKKNQTHKKHEIDEKKVSA